MEDGSHLKNEKSSYLGNALIDCHEMWQDDAYYPSTPLAVRMRLSF